ncbi:transcriptional regulator GutM [Mitsuokella jalaludinii]|uniref:transcriptional regulator GutM n=1 Tax=Mitsuokella jalaludinii TaxID=187979 RepID=UPI003F9E3F07
MLWALFLAAIAVWVLQTVLGLWQFRRFNRHVKELRSIGRVAIGKSKGRVMAGAVMLLCIDKDCRIIRGEIMEGITIFAQCKPFPALEGLNLLDLDETLCRSRGLKRQEVKAALSARKDYLDYQELQRERTGEQADPVAAKTL